MGAVMFQTLKAACTARASLVGDEGGFRADAWKHGMPLAVRWLVECKYLEQAWLSHGGADFPWRWCGSTEFYSDGRYASVAAAIPAAEIESTSSKPGEPVSDRCRSKTARRGRLGGLGPASGQRRAARVAAGGRTTLL